MSYHLTGTHRRHEPSVQQKCVFLKPYLYLTPSGSFLNSVSQRLEFGFSYRKDGQRSSHFRGQEDGSSNAPGLAGHSVNGNFIPVFYHSISHCPCFLCTFLSLAHYGAFSGEPSWATLVTGNRMLCLNAPSLIPPETNCPSGQGWDKWPPTVSLTMQLFRKSRTRRSSQDPLNCRPPAEFTVPVHTKREEQGKAERSQSISFGFLGHVSSLLEEHLEM